MTRMTMQLITETKMATWKPWSFGFMTAMEQHQQNYSKMFFILMSKKVLGTVCIQNISDTDFQKQFLGLS